MFASLCPDIVNLPCHSNSIFLTLQAGVNDKENGQENEACSHPGLHGKETHRLEQEEGDFNRGGSIFGSVTPAGTGVFRFKEPRGAELTKRLKSLLISEDKFMNRTGLSERCLLPTCVSDLEISIGVVVQAPPRLLTKQIKI